MTDQKQPPLAERNQSPKFDPALLDDLNGQQAPEEEVLLSWSAPNRPFKKRNKEFFTTVFLICVLVSLILFFANQFLPIAVVLALGFLTYVLASVPPEIIQNKITTYGIYTADHMCFWFELGNYWFTKKYKHYILHIESAKFPYRMILLFDEKEKTTLEKTLDLYLYQQAPKATWFDRAADWLQEKVPLDREEKVSAVTPSATPKN